MKTKSYMTTGYKKNRYKKIRKKIKGLGRQIVHITIIQLAFDNSAGLQKYRGERDWSAKAQPSRFIGGSHLHTPNH